MSFEKIHFDANDPEMKIWQVYGILEELRKLQSDYFKSASGEDRALVEEGQRKLTGQLEDHAKEILEYANNPAMSEADRDVLMGRWGSIMDQLAIHIPWSELNIGGERKIQEGALRELRLYFGKHPQAKDVARSIFLLFHHGAGIDEGVTAEAYRMFQEQTPLEEFARQYVDAENKGKVFLEKYIALALGREDFSLDGDYQELIETEHMSDAQASYILDAANWYRRIAFYQKISGLSEDHELYVQRAIELYKRLIEKDPSLRQFLDALYREQEITDMDL